MIIIFFILVNNFTKMKELKLIIVLISLFYSFETYGQDLKSIENTNGETIDLNQGFYLINFWATWCGPCLKELDAISDEYEDWQEETGVTIVAISIDDSRTSKRVQSLVSGKGWEYEIVKDQNQDLKRTFNVINPPHNIIVKDGKILYEHSGYSPGDEAYLLEKLIELK
jgi:thiol-disulfide isomerase/thioredoxin